MAILSPPAGWLGQAHGMITHAGWGRDPDLMRLLGPAAVAGARGAYLRPLFCHLLHAFLRDVRLLSVLQEGWQLVPCMHPLCHQHSGVIVSRAGNPPR